MTPRGWAAFAAVSVLWGFPYLFIKIAVDHGATPSFVAFGRVALAAAILLPLAARAGALRGLGARWQPLVAFAAVEIAIPFPLIAFGEQRVSSSLTAILIATVPLTVAILALRFDASERVDRTRFAGLLVGLAGVVLLLGIDVAGSADELLGSAAILVSVVGYAIGPMIVKRALSDVDPLGPVTVALAISAAMLAPFAVLDAPATTPDASALWSIAALGVVCTAMAFVADFILIAEVGASRATVITYVNPIIAVALGVTLLGESLTFAAVAGLLLILAGSWFATSGGAPPGLTAALGRAPWPRRA
ncbi:MAG TPA: DMT family transporter [Solirubrobacteraceae bacterium]|nr:DMT family transporter [Solirubrobacteraceae bacterium]